MPWPNAFQLRTCHLLPLSALVFRGLCEAQMLQQQHIPQAGKASILQHRLLYHKMCPALIQTEEDIKLMGFCKIIRSDAKTSLCGKAALEATVVLIGRLVSSMYAILCWLTSNFSCQVSYHDSCRLSFFLHHLTKLHLLPTPFSRSFMNALKSIRLSRNLMKGITDHPERVGKVHPSGNLPATPFLGDTQNSTELGVTWLHVDVIPVLSSSLQSRELQRSLSNLYYSIILWLVPNATFTQSTQRVIKTSHYYFVLSLYNCSYLTEHITTTVTCNGWMVHQRVLIFFYFFFKPRSQWDLLIQITHILFYCATLPPMQLTLSVLCNTSSPISPWPVTELGGAFYTSRSSLKTRHACSTALFFGFLAHVQGHIALILPWLPSCLA